ncbi:hypothetical protein H0H87_007574 [Tephrocybe sp. NHM501043]|nr:hypothetical protein H0H87_007574 [Tephrocybe sp. NHM501043]
MNNVMVMGRCQIRAARDDRTPNAKGFKVAHGMMDGNIELNTRVCTLLNCIWEEAKTVEDDEFGHLDSGFFAALHEWNCKHPEKPLNRIFGDVKIILESDRGKEVLAMIPDLPFLARTIVQGLATIFNVTVSLSEYGEEITRFADEIVAWIEMINESFVEAGDGHFTKITWNNLQHMREIILEIVDWKKKNLVQSSFTDCLATKSIISQYKQMIDHARTIFKVMLGKIERNAETKRIHDTLMEKLPHIAKTAYYGPRPVNSFGLLASPDAESRPSQRHLQRHHQTTSPNGLFPNLARQLCLHSSSLPNSSHSVEMCIHHALEEQPSLLDRLSEMQAQKIFLDAVNAASEIDRTKAVVIVIDGLDEMARANWKETAKTLSSLFDRSSGHPNVKILISSRAEDDISRHFLYAATLSAYLQEYIEDYGTEETDELLVHLQATDAKRGITGLYNVILGRSYRQNSEPWQFETFRRLVGTIVVSKEQINLEQLKNLLELKKQAVHI